MFCRKCGKELAEDTVFCPSCGTPVNDNNAAESNNTNPQFQRSATEIRMAARASEINELDKMINYFGKKRSSYIAYDDAVKRMYIYGRKHNNVFLVFAIIFSFFSFLMIIPLMTDLVYLSDYTYLIAMAIVFGITFLFYFFDYRKMRAQRNNYSQACKEFYKYEDELVSYYKNYGDCLVGLEFTNPSNLAVIKQVISYGGADNTKDAINILTVNSRRRIKASIALQTAVRTSKAARGSTAATIFSAGTFFFR